MDMDAKLVRYFDGRKFMWDGNEYTTEREAEEKRKEYSDNGFAAEVKKEGNKFLVYTRRVVVEIAVDKPA
ncbi:MAG: hypothetical protein Kow0090_00630 [Myxococcota bacterium]